MSRIYLVGFMGVGKSTVGKLLARHLGFKHIDLDDVFEHKYKINIDQFFNKYGEDLFREIEHRLLLETFIEQDVVISTGGGSVLTNDAMDKINRKGITVYLEMTNEGLASRLKNAKKRRPLLVNKSESQFIKTIEDKMIERSPIYNKAKIKVKALNIDIAALADQIRNIS